MNRDRRLWKVEENCMQHLKGKIASKWRTVGQNLKIEDHKLEQLLAQTEKKGVVVTCYQMLRLWRYSNGPAATYGALSLVLQDAGFTDEARDLLAGKFDYDDYENSSNPAGFEATGRNEKPPQTAAAPPAVRLPHYKMNNKSRGICLILTYDTFDEGKNMQKPRHGNKVDEGNLVKTFVELGFSVTSRINLDKEKSMDIIRTMAEKESDSFVLFICSHGNEESFCTSDNEKIALQDVITPFNADKCKGFFNKPKMFFFNSCRGKKKDEMAEADDAESHFENAGVVSNITYYRPTQADFCVVLSTVPGFKSYRYLDPTEGSYFVRNLVASLKKHNKEHHLLDILTMSNETIIREFEGMRVSSGIPNSICQVPTIISTLTRAVYFVDK